MIAVVGEREDLVVLVADTDAMRTIEAMLARPTELGIRPIRYTVRKESGHDAACRIRAADNLREVHHLFHHALVVFDHHGCSSSAPRERVQEEVTARLRINGWGDRARTIVIEPELEAWAWGDTAGLAGALGWDERSLVESLAKRGLREPPGSKPADPKKALEIAVRGAPHRRGRGRKKLSPRLYQELAAVIPMTGCRTRRSGNCGGLCGPGFRHAPPGRPEAMPLRLRKSQALRQTPAPCCISRDPLRREILESGEPRRPSRSFHRLPP